jgi:hypothetical protein
MKITRVPAQSQFNQVVIEGLLKYIEYVKIESAVACKSEPPRVLIRLMEIEVDIDWDSGLCLCVVILKTLVLYINMNVEGIAEIALSLKFTVVSITISHTNHLFTLQIAINHTVGSVRPTSTICA